MFDLNPDSNFEQQNLFDSKSNIKIGFRLKDDVEIQLKSTIFQLKQVNFDKNQNIFDEKMSKFVQCLILKLN